MAQDRVPLFVRLPHEQAAALDRLVGSTGRRKQQLVSELLGDQLGLGRIEIREGGEPADAEEVLTLDELAALLRIPARTVRARARAGELPGRRFADEWRFSRAAVLEWLGAGEGDDGRRPGDREGAGEGG